MYLRKVYRWFSVGALVLVLALGLVGPASASTVSPLVRVSGPSPYASCVNAGEPGTVYTNAEVEPYVAVNPGNPKNIMAAGPLEQRRRAWIGRRILVQWW